MLFPLLKWALIGAGTMVALVVFFSSVMKVTRIEAGYEGVEINLAGSQRGAADIPIRTGWVFYSPLRTQIIEFPTFVQTVKWTHDFAEGHATNEEMSFNTKEGMNICADVSVSYAIDPLKVPNFYVKYRVNELEKFTHGILRDIVRNSLNEVASTYMVETIDSAGMVPARRGRPRKHRAAQLRNSEPWQRCLHHEMELFYSATVSSTVKDDATRAPGVGV